MKLLEVKAGFSDALEGGMSASVWLDGRPGHHTGEPVGRFDEGAVVLGDVEVLTPHLAEGADVAG